MSLPSQPLGRSGIQVSRLALGSWRTYERIGREGGPGPAATQPPYSLVRREIVEDPGLRHLAATGDVAVVASYTMAAGVLTGKYDQDPEAGRGRGHARAAARGVRGGGPW